MLDNDLKKVQNAQIKLRALTTEEKNLCLERIALALVKEDDLIIKANQKDIENAIANGLSSAMIERLTLNQERILGLAKSISNVIKLDDPVGRIVERINGAKGLIIDKVMVPFGSIAVIFESRPNVCVDIATLCLKTSNACILKGGKEAINTNRALVNVMKRAIKDLVDDYCIYLIDDTSREATKELITKRGLIDLLIPRGGKGLIQYIVNNAKVPFIETGAGNCHLYVHKEANLDEALKIAINAKYQRPSVCNSIENILVDQEIAPKFLPRLKETFDSLNVEIRGCEETIEYIDCHKATLEDFDTEYNDYIVSVKVVKDINEAINHINSHSSKHSEAIVTDNELASELFMNLVDSSCVYHNASTRFTDGGEFGFGAEIGISTQKLHARGPMGLREICTYKYKIYGKGQVR